MKNLIQRLQALDTTSTKPISESVIEVSNDTVKSLMRSRNANVRTARSEVDKTVRNKADLYDVSKAQDKEKKAIERESKSAVAVDKRSARIKMSESIDPQEQELMQLYIDGKIDRDEYIDRLQASTVQDYDTVRSDRDPYGHDVAGDFEADLDELSADTLKSYVKRNDARANQEFDKDRDVNKWFKHSADSSNAERKLADKGHTKTSADELDDAYMESLRSLSGIKQPVAECQMDTAPGQSTPANICITAASGAELSTMLKDIMSLAGVRPVTPDQMPTVGDVATVKTIAPKSMQDMIAFIDDEEPEMAEDSMNREWDNSPEEEEGPDGVRTFGDINSGDHRERQKGLPVANPQSANESLVNALYADYKKFVSEAVEAKTKDRQNRMQDAEVKKQGKLEQTSSAQKSLKVDETLKPSKGMSAKEKSALVKKAVSGKDIGKKGPGFAKVEKAADKSGAKDPKAVAGAVMWRTAAKK